MTFIMVSDKSIIKTIEDRILTIRGQRVMIGTDLAMLYGVPAKRLNEQERSNINRFPSDFMFRLTMDEKKELVANCDRLDGLKYSKMLPLAFAEHGAIMAANVMNSTCAVEMSAFVKLRELLSSHKELSRKLAV